MARIIDGFYQEYAFLSMYAPAPVYLDGMWFPTGEHAYHAEKTTDPLVRRKLALCHDPSESKELGCSMQIRPDWDTRRVRSMYLVNWLKFAQTASLRERLLATGDALLIHKNAHGDLFWGVTRMGGENMLGLILMRVRLELSDAAKNPPPPSVIKALQAQKAAPNCRRLYRILLFPEGKPAGRKSWAPGNQTVYMDAQHDWQVAFEGDPVPDGSVLVSETPWPNWKQAKKKLR